jgi:putative hydrolase of the HAD superfamily
LSIVGEFARELHEKYPSGGPRPTIPLQWPGANEKLTDIRVVIFDIYGTLFNYWKTEFAQGDSKERTLLETFGKTISYFGMEAYLLEMDPGARAEKTLWDLYHGLILLKQQMLLEKDIAYPEVKIEDVWKAILLMLKRRGYIPPEKIGDDDTAARCIAYYYNFNVFQRTLYPGVTDALCALKAANIKLGILSNAQFYTPIDITLLLRDQSDGRIEDMGELFDHDLVFYSYEYNAAKPSQFLFRKLFDALYECHVLPSQTLMVGNDLAADIKPAKEAGMKTALFVGDERCTFLHDLRGSVEPDVTFLYWKDLPAMISFFEK